MKKLTAILLAPVTLLLISGIFQGLESMELSRIEEIEDNQIVFDSRSKQLIEVFARSALAQTSLQDYVKFESAMSVLRGIGRYLSHRKTLIRTIKIVAVVITGAIGAAFFFPAVDRFFRVALTNPVKILAGPNGIPEESVLDFVSNRTDRMLSHIGLADVACREKSACYLGGYSREIDEDAGKKVLDFARHNLIGINENSYFKSFARGYGKQDCDHNTTISIDKCAQTVLESTIWPVLPEFLHLLYMSPKQAGKRGQDRSIDSNNVK